MIFVDVELTPGRRRTLLSDVTLSGDPPEVLRAAVAETLAMLRVAWIGLLDQTDDWEHRQLDATHAALQCELATTEWTWSAGAAEGHALGRRLARRREALRQAVALPRPYGVGLLLPRQARASEPLPRCIVDALVVLDRDASGSSEGDALRDSAQAVIGAWRLREMEAGAASSMIAALFARSAPSLPARPEEGPPLRAAS